MAFNRRTALLTGLALTAGSAWMLRPGDRGSNHDRYFDALESTLQRAGIGKPSLVIDKQALANNTDTLRERIGGRYHYRIVVKSLPSLPLVKMVMERASTRRLMLFHQPFINRVASEIPDADVLLGKPMPVAAARQFYDNLGQTSFDPSQQLQWLIDTPTRAHEYGQLATALGQPLRINIEIDVGLHRGGTPDSRALLETLDAITQYPQLRFAGLMGYEPHIAKLPGNIIKHRDAAMARYAAFVQAAKQRLGDAWPDDVTLNSGGSGTYQLYDQEGFPFNELASGSCLVQPTDFDGPTLADHQPAAFIAAPVLKTLDHLSSPADSLARIQRWWDVNSAQTFFQYGGYWKAKAVSPVGLKNASLLGRSTNQEGLVGSASIRLEPGDWIFHRPTQSEHVFLQFGDILVYERGELTETWPTFDQV